MASKILYAVTLLDTDVVSVVVTENNKLAVRLETSKGEFIGMVFTSMNSLKDYFTRFSKLEMSDETYEGIRSAYEEPGKITPEHLEKVQRYTSLLNYN